MNYIVFDLEWNQCPYGKEYEEKSLPFEILEIGAVKLNRQFEEIDRFYERIRPAVYTSFHFRTQEILHLNMEEFADARPFAEVCADFLSWCGKRAWFCTWGPSDLLELQRNMRYHKMENPFFFPLRYLDIQKLFSLSFEDGRSRKSLEYAVDALSLPKEKAFHSALNDAVYTARILESFPSADVLSNYSVDYFRIPQDRREEFTLRFDTYTKYVSRTFSSRTAAMRDRKVTAVNCYLCKRPAKRRLRWFLSGSRNYYCLAHCEEHGWIKGKIRLKKCEADPERVFCVKTLKLVGEEEAKRLEEKKEAAARG